MSFILCTAIQPASRDAVLAVDYEDEFACAVGKDNYIGTQFHPEKSAQEVGLWLLARFRRLGWPR